MGGAERVAQNLARQLTAGGHGVRLIVPEDTGEEALGWFRSQGVEAEASSALRDYMQPRSRNDVLALRRLIQRSRADVVNLQYPVSWVSLKDTLAVRLAGNARCIATVHSIAQGDSEMDPQQVKNTRLAVRLCHSVTVVSEWSREHMLKMGLPPGKVRVVPNGVEPPAHPPTAREAREHLGIPAEAFVISTLARLVPGKGIADLIKAVSLMKDPNRSIRLVIGGDGEERPRLEALARECLGDRALFLGQVLGDTSMVYAACDVFALPSHMESFGLVYVEAAFHGVPSVGTLVGGIPEAVVDGKTGLLVPVGDAPAIAEAIQRLRDNPGLRRSMGAAARARACAEFTEAAMAERYCKIFRGMSGEFIR